MRNRKKSTGIGTRGAKRPGIRQHEASGRFRAVLVAAALALAAGCGALGAAQEGAKVANTNRGAAERGQKQYVQTCSFCHGADATGARGPDLLRSPLVADDVNGNLIGPVIRQGRPDKGMPPLPLSTQAISDIAAFLHARAVEALNSARLPKVYPVEKLLTGKAGQGEKFFLGAGGCKACHSPTGDLAHIARKYSPLDLEARMLFPRGEGKRSVTVTLPSGEKVEGELEHIDEFSVALRDSSGQHRSFSLDGAKAEVHDPLAAHQALLNRLTQANFHDLFAYLERLK